METFLIILTIIFFLILTSYFNVVIHRGFKKSLTIPSRSDLNDENLRWWQMIPIISTSMTLLYNWLRKNKQNIDPNYLWTEIYGLTIGLYVAYMYAQGVLSNFSGVLLLAIIFILFFQSLWDTWRLEIWEVLAILTIVLSGLQLLFTGILLFTLAEQLLAAFLFSGFIIFLMILTKGKGLGSGDIYLVFFVGLSLGLQDGLIALLAALYLATAVGIVMIVVKRQFKGIKVPLVPFLTLGWLIALNFGEQIINTYMQFVGL